MILGVPIPQIDFFLLVLDTLARRYGWSYSEICENMYWEDVHEMFEYASNCVAMEKNEDMKFQFLLHAQSKDALDSWKDPINIPYPDRRWIPPEPAKKTSAIPPKFLRMGKAEKASEKQLKRMAKVKEKLAEYKQTVKEKRFGKFKQ